MFNKITKMIAKAYDKPTGEFIPDLERAMQIACHDRADVRIEKCRTLGLPGVKVTVKTGPMGAEMIVLDGYENPMYILDYKYWKRIPSDAQEREKVASLLVMAAGVKQRWSEINRELDRAAESENQTRGRLSVA